MTRNEWSPRLNVPPCLCSHFSDSVHVLSLSYRLCLPLQSNAERTDFFSPVLFILDGIRYWTPLFNCSINAYFLNNVVNFFIVPSPPFLPHHSLPCWEPRRQAANISTCRSRLTSQYEWLTLRLSGCRWKMTVFHHPVRLPLPPTQPSVPGCAQKPSALFPALLIRLLWSTSAHVLPLSTII